MEPLEEQQALALASRLASRKLVAAYASPLRAAVRTAELVLSKQDTHSPALSLREREPAPAMLASIRQNHADGDILIVSDATVLRLLLAHFLEMGPERISSLEVDPCALSIVDDYEVPLIMAINDCCHLEGVRSGLSAQVR